MSDDSPASARMAGERPRIRPQSSAPSIAPGPISISVVSDSRLLSEGLLSLLPIYIDLLSIRSFEAGLLQPQAVPPGEHVVLLDSAIGLPAVRTWARYWQASQPGTRVLVLDLPDDLTTILAFIEAGASAYTLLGASVHDVANAVRWLVQGKVYGSPELVAQLVSRANRMPVVNGAEQPRQPTSALTPREMEVLACLVKGYGNREIAAELYIEVRTVKHHVHNLLDKLRLRHRYEAARLALEQGWPVAS